MPIEFQCPGCQKQYRVKEELAGKSAKCGKCSHRMQIPRPAPPESVDLAELDTGLGGWSDDELQAPAPVVASAAPPPSLCKECGAPMAGDAVVCLLCGYDKRTGAKHVKKTGAEGSNRGGRWAVSEIPSLLRGSAFSFGGALLGAILWAIVAYLTNRQFGIIAWALGGLAGAGMAFGHEDDDGTTAGIIAACMSLVGIVMAKVLIVVIVIAAVVASVVDDEPIDTTAIDSSEFQRSMVAADMADDTLKQWGVDPTKATEAQWSAAADAARIEVNKLSEDEVATRYANQLEANKVAVETGSAAGSDDPSLIAMFFQLMFSPMDGIFILFAFFTAYRVGSGGFTD